MRIAFVLVILLTMACGSCKSPPNGKAADLSLETPEYQELARAHNDRVAQLRRLYAEGVIEIRWQDDKGKHFEQGNIELWLSLPRQTALRVEKLGEVLLWLGSDQERYWLFDMIGKEKVLHVHRHDQPVATETVGGALNVQPLTLLDLMGLTPLPDGGAEPPAVEYDADRKAWRTQIAGSGGPMRIFFDRATMLPARVETIAPDGTVALFSALRRYESASQAGAFPGAYPKIAELIDIEGGSDLESAKGKRTSGEVKIALNQATGDFDYQVLKRVFDLDRLISGLRPDRIEGQTAAEVAASGAAPR